MTDQFGVKTVRPRKRALPAGSKAKAPKPQLHTIEHVRYGEGKLVFVRQLDSGEHIALVKFGDGVERILRLRQQYWLTDIAPLIPTPLKVKARKSAPVEVSDDEEDGEPELGEDEAEAEEIEALA